MQTYVTIKEIVERLGFKIVNRGNFEEKVYISNIYKIGYELIGFIDKNSDELNKYINICGIREAKFVETFEQEKKEKIISDYMGLGFPALIFSKNAIIPAEFLKYGEKYKKNILRSNESTSVTIRKLKFFLSKSLSFEEIFPDYCLLEIHGIGVLLSGFPSVKKSVTVELLERGHRMITDKNVVIRRMGENDLVGYNEKKMDSSEHFYLENVGNTSIDVTEHFGVRSTRKNKKINLIIFLEKWNEKKFYDRLGLDPEYESLLGEKILKKVLPIRKGRNLAVIIETAALDFRLRKMGLNTPMYFLKMSEELIQRKKEGKYLMNNKMPMIRLKNEFELEVIYGEEQVKDTYIATSNVYRPSLSLIGFFDEMDEQKSAGIQVFSEVEFNFLDSLSEEEKINNLRKYLSYEFPLLVLTRDAKPPQYFLDLVKESNHILVSSPFRKSSQLIANFNNYLDSYFSESISVHGVFLELFGFGVLLTGKSGIGKSETALELIHRGHRLVADDIVKFSRDTQGDIIGFAGDIPFFMEIRGLGIIDIKTLYGLGAVRLSKRLDMIIELQEVENTDYTAIPTINSTRASILSVPIRKKILEISSGRNAAAMVEIIVMDHMSVVLGQK